MWFLKFSYIDTLRPSLFILTAALPVDEEISVYSSISLLMDTEVSFHFFLSCKQCCILILVSWDICLEFSPRCIFSGRIARRAIICIFLIASKVDIFWQSKLCPAPWRMPTDVHWALCNHIPCSSFRPYCRHSVPTTRSSYIFLKKPLDFQHSKKIIVYVRSW